MRIYVAGHHQKEALAVADVLRDAGHEIVSSWLYTPFLPTLEYTIADRIQIAVQDLKDIDRSDCLVILSCISRVPGGKFVEAGYALGQKKPVFLLGHVENMLMYHPGIVRFDCVEELIRMFPAEWPSQLPSTKEDHQ